MKICPWCNEKIFPYEDEDAIEEEGKWWHMCCYEDWQEEERKAQKEDARLDDPRHEPRR